ncbi:MAG: hypothetical protein RLY58_2308 [Pseudomonadota bacterium]|jgi:regulator of protease activity HflC (stomatin/prohibitin superfamily)
MPILKAPSGVTSISADGVEYIVDANGVIDAPVESVDAAIASGFTPVEADAHADALKAKADAEAKAAAEQAKQYEALKAQAKADALAEIAKEQAAAKSAPKGKAADETKPAE